MRFAYMDEAGNTGRRYDDQVVPTKGPPVLKLAAANLLSASRSKVAPDADAQWSIDTGSRR